MNPIATTAQANLIGDVSLRFEGHTATSPLNCKFLPSRILSNASLEDITHSLKRCKAALKGSFTGSGGLSVHHLAAIVNRIELLDLLCPQSMKPTQLPKDAKKWNPLHFRAALADEKTLQKDAYTQAFLEKCNFKGKNALEGKTIFNQTPVDIFNQIFAQENPYSMGHTKAFETARYANLDSNSSFLHPLTDSVSVDSTCFAANFNYVTDSVASREAVMGIWNHFDKVQMQTPHIIKKSYANFLENPPKLQVKSTEGKGCGLYADEDIAQGRVVTDFHGEYVLDELDVQAQRYTGTPTNYYHDLHMQEKEVIRRIGSEPKWFRGVGAMMNDGPPSVVEMQIFNEDGSPAKLIFVATREIKKGEELTFDYGAGQSVKMQNYQIDGSKYQQLVDLIKDSKVPFSKLFSLLDGMEDPSMNHISGLSPAECTELSSNYLYLLNTPSVMYQLIKDGHINEDDFRALLDLGNRAHYTAIPMISFRLQNGFLLSMFKNKCEAAGNMKLLNFVMKTLEQSFSRFSKAHTNEDQESNGIDKVLESVSLERGLNKLLNADSLDPSKTKKLISEFRGIYAKGPLFEHLTKKEITEETESLMQVANERAVSTMIKSNVWSYARLAMVSIMG